MTNFKGQLTETKPLVVIELENMLGIEFKLYKPTGSLYGEYKGLKIRLSNHASLFVENKKGDFDFNYNANTAKYIFDKLNNVNRFSNLTPGQYIQHSREERVGKCYFRSYNSEYKYVEVTTEDGEIKRYDESIFVNI